MSTEALHAAEIVKSHLGVVAPESAIVLGAGLYGAADIVDECRIVLPYAELPGFPRTPASEDGELAVCHVDGAPTLVLKGRADFHEMGDPSLMSNVVETLALSGVRSLISIGFANSVNPALSPGAVVAISDHIDFKGLNPLIGAGRDGAFLNMNEVYDKRQLRRLKYAASGAGASLHEGVLAWMSGPTFETVAEARAVRILGADLVGMSIVPEAILAKRFRLPFAGVAVVLDFAAGVSGGAPDGDFASAPVAAALVQLKRLLRACLKK